MRKLLNRSWWAAQANGRVECHWAMLESLQDQWLWQQTCGPHRAVSKPKKKMKGLKTKRIGLLAQVGALDQALRSRSRSGQVTSKGVGDILPQGRRSLAVPWLIGALDISLGQLSTDTYDLNRVIWDLSKYVKTQCVCYTFMIFHALIWLLVWVLCAEIYLQIMYNARSLCTISFPLCETSMATVRCAASRARYGLLPSRWHPPQADAWSFTRKMPRKLKTGKKWRRKGRDKCWVNRWN